jgi:hypothetical protein
MATVSTPVSAWVAALLTSTGVNISSSLYVSVSITAGWEIQLPIQVQVSSVSADPIVNIYPSMDGGANYDTQPMTSFALARNTAAPRITKGSIRLSTGQYLIQMLASGYDSQSFAVNTAVVITSILNQ